MVEAVADALMRLLLDQPLGCLVWTLAEKLSIDETDGESNYGRAQI